MGTSMFLFSCFWLWMITNSSAGRDNGMSGQRCSRATYKSRRCDISWSLRTICRGVSIDELGPRRRAGGARTNDAQGSPEDIIAGRHGEKTPSYFFFPREDRPWSVRRRILYCLVFCIDEMCWFCFCLVVRRSLSWDSIGKIFFFFCKRGLSWSRWSQASR